MIRRIIQIDEEKCNGCGACASACHEGAIQMVGGKAKLIRDDYCDGLGDCLPACPTDAIHFVEREAAPYDAAAVEAARGNGRPGGCPGSAARSIAAPEDSAVSGARAAELPGRLTNWPVQIQLAPLRAPYYEGADLLIAADCTAFAHGNFHERFMRGRTTLIACPKLDHVNYAEKLAAILSENDVRSLTLARMQVPCCGGLEHMLRAALENSGKRLPLEVVTLSLDGRVVDVQKR